jgi:hypothetical protein
MKPIKIKLLNENARNRLIRNLMGVIIIEVIVLSITDILLSKILYLVGFFMGMVIVLRMNNLLGQSLSTDLFVAILTLSVSLVTIFILKVMCNLLPDLYTCTPNQINALFFSNLSFPLIPVVIFWLVTRVPVIVRNAFRK